MEKLGIASCDADTGHARDTNARDQRPVQERMSVEVPASNNLMVPKRCYSPCWRDPPHTIKSDSVSQAGLCELVFLFVQLD
jgi:hypothetical protein